MRIVELGDTEISKLFNLVLEYKQKPYHEYVKDNNLLTDIFMKKLESAHNQVKFFAVEDHDDCKAFITLRKSTWDSTHFGINVGKIDYLVSKSPKAVKFLLERIRNSLDMFDLIMMRIPTSDPSFIALQDANFRVMETTVTYSYKFDSKPINKINDSLKIREAQASDIESLKDISRRGFSDYRSGQDHFHADPILPTLKSDELYTKWIENIFREKTETIFVAELDGKVVGYYTCHLNEEIRKFNFSMGIATLSAVHPEYFGKGIYTSLINHSQKWFSDKVQYEELGGQIENIAVQRAWISNGFKIIRAQYALHYHGKETK